MGVWDRQDLFPQDHLRFMFEPRNNWESCLEVVPGGGIPPGGELDPETKFRLPGEKTFENMTNN